MHTQKNSLVFLVVIFTVVTLGIVMWPHDEEEKLEAKRSAMKVSERGRSGNLDASGDTNVQRSSVRVALQENLEREKGPYANWKLSKILDYFMVPPGEFEATNLNDATQKLKAIYSACSGRTLLIETSQGVKTKGAIFFQHGNISFRALMGMIAALNGCTVEVEGDEVRWANASSRQEIVNTMTYPLMKRPEQIRELAADPEKARSYFAEAGIIWSEEAPILSDPDALAQLITNFQQEMTNEGFAPSQVKVNHQFVSILKGETLEAMAFSSQEEVDSTKRSWSQMKGTNVMTAPSIVMRPGQEGKIEMIREFIYPSDGENVEFENKNLGLILPIKVVVAGLDRLQIEVTTEMTRVRGQGMAGFFPGMLNTASPVRPLLNSKGGIDESSFDSIITESEVHMLDDGTVLIPIGTDGDSTIYQLVRGQRIGADGAPLLQAE